MERYLVGQLNKWTLFIINANKGKYFVCLFVLGFGSFGHQILLNGTYLEEVKHANVNKAATAIFWQARPPQ